MFEGEIEELKAKAEELVGGGLSGFRREVGAVRKAPPSVAGVYVIYDERGDAIYVGGTKDLKRRLYGDHLRGSVRGSAFRKYLFKKLGLKDEESIDGWIRDNCKFRFICIPDDGLRKRLECFMIAVSKPRLQVSS